MSSDASAGAHNDADKEISKNTNVDKSDAFEVCGRIGYATKGVVYLIVGGLAAAAAWGAGGETTGSKGAIQTIAEQPFGQAMLWVVAVGLFGYAIWRLVEAFYNTDTYNSNTSAVARVGYAVSGIIYGVLAWKVAPFSASSTQSGGNESKQTAASWLMSLPAGAWIVAAIGVAVGGYGIYLIYKGATDSFTDKYNSGSMSQAEAKIARYAGRIGLPARGVVFGVIGLFVIIASMTLDPSKVKGTGEALDVLARQPYGTWVLLAVAVGLVFYGVFCFVQARYRSFAC